MKRNGHRSGRLLSVLAILLVSCAREEMPPGTGPDFEAPAVVEMFPRYGSAVPGMDEDAYVRFDEPLGDQAGQICSAIFRRIQPGYRSRHYSLRIFSRVMRLSLRASTSNRKPWNEKTCP